MDWNASQVTSVRLLGCDSDVRWEMTPQGLQITPPKEFGGSKYAWAFEIVTDREQHIPNAIQRDASRAMKGTKKVDQDGYHTTKRAAPMGPAHPTVKPFVLPGSTVVIETASSAGGFHKLKPTSASGRKVTANQATRNDPLKSLTDGKLVAGIGPVFGNGIRDGAYKMDLGSVQSVSAITSWSNNWKGHRGAQKLILYGSDAATDPGWDLTDFTPLGIVGTTTQAKAEFTAASLRASAGQSLGQSLGQFRWIVWAVSPVTKTEGGENTAFQELAVEVVKSEKSVASGKFDILYIVAADQAPFDLKTYEPESTLDTPVLDRLAAEGLVIDGAHQMGAWSGGVCTPSRHMIMSGRTLWHVPDKSTFVSRIPIASDPRHVPPDLADHTMAAVFNAAGYDTMRTCKKGNSYEAANKRFMVVHDATKRGGTDESGSGWPAKQVLNYLDGREASGDQDPFLIDFGFSHPRDIRDGKPELPEILLETNCRLEVSQHRTPEAYVQRFRELKHLVWRWREEYPGIQIKIRQSHRGWMRQYNVEDGKPIPFESKPVAAYRVCMQKTCTQLYRSMLWKCPALAYFNQVEAKLNLHHLPQWQPFRDYHACLPARPTRAMLKFTGSYKTRRFPSAVFARVAESPFIIPLQLKEASRHDYFTRSQTRT